MGGGGWGAPGGSGVTSTGPGTKLTLEVPPICGLGKDTAQSEVDLGTGER